MTATALTLALEALKTEQSLRLGYTHGAHGRLESTADAAIAALTAAIAQAGEPFGYFRAEPFGWTNCAETDEGAIALYEHPAAKDSTAAMGWRLVPVEPTKVMLDAVVTSMDEAFHGRDAEKQYREDWDAMLAAAPLPPAPQGDGHE
jgi:hypothetical protein